MTRRRKVLRAIAIFGLLLVAILALRVAPLFTGPALPAGASRLQLATASPNVSLGCATAALSPVRISTSGDELVLVSVESGQTVRVVWPAGFGAWRIDGRAVVADPWGSVVGRDGDVLDSLGGGLGIDDAFYICPFGIAIRP
jgi:ABC-type amino acid transport substrate-binding protein